MGNLDDAIKEALTPLVCAGAAGGGWVAGLLARGGLPVTSIENAIKSFEARVCNKNPSDLTDSVGTPPYEGGQCSGIQYRYDVVAIASNGATVRSNGQFAFGALGIPYPEGNTVKLPVEDGNRILSYFNFVPGVVATSATLENVTRADNQPDTCGNPPTDIDPIDEHDDEIDVDYTDENDNPVSLPDLPVRFFPPCIWFDGIRIPFEVQTPWGVPICGKIGLRPDVSNILEPDLDIDVCPDEKQRREDSVPEEVDRLFDISAPIGTGGTEPEADLAGTGTISFDPENDKPVLALLVKTSKSTNSGFTQTVISNGPNDQSPNLTVPRLGWVRWKMIANSEEGIFWDYSEPVDIVQVEQFFPCPWPDGAAGAEVTWLFPWDGTYREVRAKSCCGNCGSADPREDLPLSDRCRID